LKHSLKQAETTFRLSILPIVTTLTGALFTVGGGALAVHARRARSHVTTQANRIDEKIDHDHKLETATTLIDRIGDPVVRDRLNAAAAMKALGVQPSPETMVDRLLPEPGGRSAGEIEPGEPSR